MKCYVIRKSTMHQISCDSNSMYLYNDTDNIAHVQLPFNCYELAPKELRFVSKSTTIDTLTTNEELYIENDKGLYNLLEVLLFDGHVVVAGVCTIDTENYAIPLIPVVKESVSVVNYCDNVADITFPEYSAINGKLTYTRILLLSGTKLTVKTNLPMYYGAFKDLPKVSVCDYVADTLDCIVTNETESNYEIMIDGTLIPVYSNSYIIISSGGNYA